MHSTCRDNYNAAPIDRLSRKEPNYEEIASSLDRKRKGDTVPQQPTTEVSLWYKYAPVPPKLCCL